MPRRSGARGLSDEELSSGARRPTRRAFARCAKLERIQPAGLEPSGPAADAALVEVRMANEHLVFELAGERFAVPVGHVSGLIKYGPRDLRRPFGEGGPSPGSLYTRGV